MAEEKTPTWDETTPIEAGVPTWDETTPVEEGVPTWEETSPEEEKKAPAKETSPWLISDLLTDKEIDSIASKYGVDRNNLVFGADMNSATRNLTPEERETIKKEQTGKLGVAAGDPTLETYKIMGKQLAGYVNRSLGNAPFKVYSKVMYDEKTQRALHDLEQMIDKKESYLAMAAQMAVPVPIFEAKVAGLAGKELLKEGVKAGAKTGAAFGAATGFGKSAPGEELVETTKGAALGAALGGGLGAIPGAASLVLGTDTAKATGKRVAEAFNNIKDSSTLKKGWEFLAQYSKPRELAHVVEDAQKMMEAKATEEGLVKEALTTYLKNPNADVDERVGEFLVKPEVWKKTVDKRIRQLGEDQWTAEQYVAKLALNREKEALAKILEPGATKASTDETIVAHLGGLSSPAQISKAYDEMRFRNYMTKSVDKSMSTIAANMSHSTLLDKVIGAQHVAAETDRRYGTTLETLLGKLVNASDQASHDTFGLLDISRDLGKQLDKMASFKGRDGQKYLTELVEAGKSGRESLMAHGLATREEIGIAESYAKALKYYGDHFKEKGMGFTERKALDGSANYMPHVMLDEGEAVEAVSRRYDALRTLFSSTSMDKIRKGPYKDAQDLLKSLELMTGLRPNNLVELDRAAAVLRSGGKASTKKVANARASMERTGDIPDFLREYDPSKVMGKYVLNNNRALVFKEPVRELDSQIAALKQAGDDHYTQYFEDLKDFWLNGKRETRVSSGIEKRKAKIGGEIQKLQEQRSVVYNKALEDHGPEGLAYVKGELEEFDKKIGKLRTSQEVPEFLQYALRSSIHTGLLGGKIRPGLNDLLQPFTMGINEITGTYGMSSVKEGVARTFSKPSITNWMKELEELGHLPAGYMQSLSELGMDDTLSRSLLKNIKKGHESYVKAMMYGRTMSDVTNRKVMLETARSITDDFLAGLKTMRQDAYVKTSPEELDLIDKSLVKALQEETPIALAELTKEDLAAVYGADNIASLKELLDTPFKKLSEESVAIKLKYAKAMEGIADWEGRKQVEFAGKPTMPILPKGTKAGDKLGTLRESLEFPEKFSEEDVIEELIGGHEIIKGNLSDSMTKKLQEVNRRIEDSTVGSAKWEELQKIKTRLEEQGFKDADILKPFEKSDKVGEEFYKAHEFIKNRLSPAARTEIARLARTGELNYDTLSNVVANHLINRTQFRYNKLVASQISREYGPLLTQFSKYPSEVLGSYVTAYRAAGKGAKGAADVTKKALYPTAVLYLMDQVRQSISDDDKPTPRERVFFYSDGLAGRSPLASTLSIIPGQGPEIGLYTKIAKALQDPSQWDAVMKQTFDMVKPYGASENIYNDIHTLVTGEDPRAK